MGRKGARVNCVAPTYVDTAMSRGGSTDPNLFPVWMDNTPMRPVARPDEIASAILFLASDASSAMTGSYPRDMVGYGRTPPFADWPDDARIALQFVINYEEGGENASSTATRPRRLFCPRSSAQRPGPACAT